MPRTFGQPRQSLWTFAAPGPTGVEPAGQSTGAPVVRVLTNLAEAVLATLEENIDYRAMPRGDAFEEAVHLLSGNRLKLDLLERADVSDDALQARLRQLEPAYGLDDLPEHRYHRPARALLLLAAEYKFVPIAEGVLAAIDGWPASARLDLRSAFHLVSRWWAHHLPQVAARLAVAALADLPDGDGRASRPWRPLTKFYESVLRRHRPSDRLESEARLLSAGTMQILWDAYRSRATNNEVMFALFTLAEREGILERRPPFELDADGQVRQVLTKLLLDRELGRPLDPTSQGMLRLFQEIAS